MGADPQYASYPNMLLAQHVFTIRQPNLSSSHAAAHKALLSSIEEQSQAPFYRYLAHPTDGVVAGQIKWDEAKYNELKAKNDEELQKYEKELEEAAEKAGESEIVEVMGKKAEFWARVGDKVCSADEVLLWGAPLSSPPPDYRRKLWLHTKSFLPRLRPLEPRLISFSP